MLENPEKQKHFLKICFLMNDFIRKLAWEPIFDWSQPSHLGIKISLFQWLFLSKDFDWEVKLKTASVWTKIFTKHKQDSDRNESLQNCGFFNGLILGLTDYEGSVRGRFEELLEELEDDLNLREEHCLNKIQKVKILNKLIY